MSKSRSSKNSLKPIALSSSDDSSSSSSLPQAEKFDHSVTEHKEMSSTSSLPSADKFVSSKEVVMPPIEIKVKEKLSSYFTPEMSVTPAENKAYWHLNNSEVKAYFIHGRSTFTAAVADHIINMKSPVPLAGSFVTGQATISTVFNSNPIVSAIKVYSQDDNIVFDFKNMTLFNEPATFELDFSVQITF